MSHDLGIDIETLGEGNDLFGFFWRDIYFHSVPHVEYLVHLAPVGTRTVVDSMKQWWNGKHVVFYHAAVVVDEMKHFSLCAAGAVHHAVDITAHLIKQTLDYWGISAGGGEDKFSGIQGGILDCVGELVLSALRQIAGHVVVETFRIARG